MTDEHDHDHSHAHGHVHHHDSASGERFIPEIMGGEILEAEHQARYRLALPHVQGRRVLDAGCGVGWGSKLLLEAGAASVTGLDISEEALADARDRAPAVEFVQGDLQSLPFPDGSYDVVVCFEALEHVTDVPGTLDGLVRVLAEDGVLFVSSPNPAVYPAGNPFHPSEMRPEELEAAVSARLPEVRMFHQHELAVSLVAPGGTGSVQVEMLSLTGLAPGHDPYSVAVASRVSLPDVAPFACAAPPTELKRLSTERVSVIAELEDAHARLRDADTGIRGLMAERDEANDRAAELSTQAEALRVQLDNQRLVSDNAARERDDLGMRLIAADRPVRPVQAPEPSATEAIEPGADESERLRRKVRKLRSRVKALEAELEAARSATLGSRIRRRLPGS